MSDMREKMIDVIHDNKYTVERCADAIIAALPDMVKPLEWDGVEADCFVICELDGRDYELCVSDTLERPHDYVWSAEYVVGHKRVNIPCGPSATFEAAKAAAQAHHTAAILSALGLTK